jgi:hypothetical protein
MNRARVVRIGGLLRCCVDTVETTNFKTAPKEGDVIQCRYCSDSMVYRDHAWEWNQLKIQSPK